MKFVRYLCIGVLCALVMGLLPPASTPARAQGATGYRAAIQAMVPGGRIISVWGDSRDNGERKHQGVDIGAPRGTPIRAIEPGVVTEAGWNNLGGNTISYKAASGREWYLAHMDAPTALKVGDSVSKGTIVGPVGTSGNAQGTEPHLHFQVSGPDGRWANPAVVLANWPGANNSQTANQGAGQGEDEGADGGVRRSGPWYRYQGEPSSYDQWENQKLNCGPTTVAMAIQYSLGVSVPVKDIRAFVGHNGDGTGYYDITRSLDKWGVRYKGPIRNVQNIKDALARGNIAAVSLDMRPVKPGPDVNGASTDPSLRTGAYYTGVEGHWLIVKGISADGKYFIVYDGNVWGGPNQGVDKYWYSDGKPKGMDRWYPISDFERGMFYPGRGDYKGVEILTTGRPQVSQGQEAKAIITYYALTPEETGKTPDHPEWGIMYNGKKVHWGAVAVDPEYIPLGTKLTIEGWPGQVFVAEDTGSGVKGWHIDIFWPGTGPEAAHMNDVNGGTQKITLLGPGPVFTDRIANTAPVAGTATVTRDVDRPRRWVTLSLRASDNEEDVTGMMISNDPFFTDAFEEPYVETKEWTLPAGDGVKKIYVRFKNAAGAWSDTVETQVALEEQPPVGTVTIAPDPRIALAAGLSGNTLPAIGEQPVTTGTLLYRPLGPNLLANSSFEGWAGGIPAAWDSALRERSYEKYDPTSGAYHGALALRSLTVEKGSELTQKVILKPNTQYTLSAWVKGIGGLLSVEELETQGINSRSLKTQSATSVDGKVWRLLTLSFKTTPETTDAKVRLLGADNYWDALQLEEGARPTVYRADGVLLEPAVRNLVANPSIERGPEGWSGLNSYMTAVSSPDYARYGSKALLVRKGRDGKAATIHAATLEPGRTYTFSTYARMASGAAISNDIIRGWMYEGVNRPEDVNSDELTDEKNRPPMIWQPVGGGWFRGSHTFVASAKKGLYGVMSTEKVVAKEEFYIDGIQLEGGPYLTSYVDGSLGHGYSWKGTPHASESARTKTGLIYGATEGDEGSLVFWARPEGLAPEGAALFELGSLTGRVTKAGIKVQAGSVVVGVAPWSQGSAQPYAVTWTGAEVRLYRAGRLVATGKGAGPAEGSKLSIGPSRGWAYPNAVVGDVSLWRNALAGPELQYLSTHTPLDPGLPRVNTPSTEVITSASDATEGDILVEWSEDGETWYEWEDIQRPHKWDLGEAEGTKTVWVRYTDAAGNRLTYSDQVELDLTAPQVLGARVVKGAVVVTFSEPVAFESLSSVVVSSDGIPVKGSWIYNLGAPSAVFRPVGPLPAALDLNVSTDLLDTAGNQLEEPYRQPIASTP